MPSAGLQIHAFSIQMAPRQHQVLHDHEFHEFFYCVEGTGIQVREGERMEMRPGDLFLFPAGVHHLGAGDPGSGCVGIVLYLHQRAFADISEGDAEAGCLLEALCDYSRPRARIPLSADGRAAVDAQMRRLADEYHAKAAGYRAAVKAVVSDFLVTVLRDERAAPFLQASVQPASPHDQIGDLCRYLEVHFREPISVAEAAAITGMSRSHFHAVFKRETGMTLTNYLQTLRTNDAQRLLRETDDPIIEVAMAAGFASLSHFYEVFGTRVGTSPKAYRAQYR